MERGFGTLLLLFRKRKRDQKWPNIAILATWEFCLIPQVPKGVLKPVKYS